MSDPVIQTSRRQARRNAMMFLYQLDLVTEELDAAIAGWEAKHGGPLPEYARSLATRVTEQRDRLDARLSELLEEWTVDRLGAVERAIMRIGLVELEDPDLPNEVAIDEAVELAKRYASVEASKLVNGVLGRAIEA